MAFLKMDTYCYKNGDKNEMIQVYMLIFFVIKKLKGRLQMPNDVLKRKPLYCMP